MEIIAEPLRDYFGQLAGLPCWKATANFGTWLSLDFGAPHVWIQGGDTDGKPEVRPRRAGVRGDFLLWIEMGDWEYWEGSRRKFHSGQSRAYLRRAAQRLQSQCLARVEWQEVAATTLFDFDLGGQLRVWPDPEGEPDDALWHFYTPSHCLSARANGMWEHGPLYLPDPMGAAAPDAQFVLDTAPATPVLEGAKPAND